MIGPTLRHRFREPTASGPSCLRLIRKRNIPSQTKIDGVVTVTANGGATAAVEVLLTAPRSATF